MMGKLVEFFGPSVYTLLFSDRAIISNMCHEKVKQSYFPVYHQLIEHLKITARDPEDIILNEHCLRDYNMFRDYKNPKDPTYTGDILTLNLSTVFSQVL